MARLQLFVKTFSILFIVIFTYFYRLNGYIVTVVSTGFIGIIIFELGIKNIKFSVAYFKPNLKLLKSMWHLAGFALITNIVGMLTTQIDIYVINYLITDRTEVGYYMFALTILSVYQLLPNTIQQVAFPYFSEQSAHRERWYSSYLKYNKLNHLLVLLVVLAGILFLPIVIKIAFSGKYDRSIYYFSFLSIAWMIKSANIMKGTAIMGHGRFDVNFLASLIILVITFPVVFIMVKFYGLNGAIIGMITGSVISYITVYLVFRGFTKRLAAAT